MSELPAALEKLQQQRAEQLENQRQMWLTRIYQKCRDGRGRILRQCQSNESVLRDYLGLSVDLAVEAVQRNPGQFVWINPPASKTDQGQLERDQKTLESAARENRNFGSSQANLSLIREVLGPGFSEYELFRAFQSRKLLLTPPSAEERQQWQEEDLDKEKLRLMHATTSELKAEIRNESASRRAQQTQAEAARVLQEKQEAEKDMGFPQIPDLYQGKRVNREFFKRCDRSTMRWFLQRFGDAQVTEKIRGL